MDVTPLRNTAGAEIDPFSPDGAYNQPHFRPDAFRRFAEDHFTYKTPVSIQPGKEGYPEEPVPLDIQGQIHFYTAVLLAWQHHFGVDYTFMLNPGLITKPAIQKFLQSRADILGTRIQKGWERFHERNELAKQQGLTRHAVDALAGFTGIVVGDVGYHLGNSRWESRVESPENSPLH